MNRNGRYVGVWQAGYHFVPPWMTVSHLIPQQYTVYDIPVKVEYIHLILNFSVEINSFYVFFILRNVQHKIMSW